jgi:hypothetical protein
LVSSENWHEERDRLVRLVKGIESGTITRFDEGDPRQVRIETAAQRLDRLKCRVAELDSRLGTHNVAGSRPSGYRP